MAEQAQQPWFLRGLNVIQQVDKTLWGLVDGSAEGASAPAQPAPDSAPMPSLSDLLNNLDSEIDRTLEEDDDADDTDEGETLPAVQDAGGRVPVMHTSGAPTAPVVIASDDDWDNETDEADGWGKWADGDAGEEEPKQPSTPTPTMAKGRIEPEELEAISPALLPPRAATLASHPRTALPGIAIPETRTPSSKPSSALPSELAAQGVQLRAGRGDALASVYSAPPLAAAAAAGSSLHSLSGPGGERASGSHAEETQQEQQQQQQQRTPGWQHAESPGCATPEPLSPRPQRAAAAAACAASEAGTGAASESGAVSESGSATEARSGSDAAGSDGEDDWLDSSVLALAAPAGSSAAAGAAEAEANARAATGDALLPGSVPAATARAVAVPAVLLPLRTEREPKPPPLQPHQPLQQTQQQPQPQPQQPQPQPQQPQPQHGLSGFPSFFFSAGASALEAVGSTAMRAISRDDPAAAARRLAAAAEAESSQPQQQQMQQMQMQQQAQQPSGAHARSLALAAAAQPTFEQQMARAQYPRLFSNLEALRDGSQRALDFKMRRLPPVQRAAFGQSWALLERLTLAPAKAAAGAEAAEALHRGAGPDAQALVAAAIGALVQPALAAMMDAMLKRQRLLLAGGEAGLGRQLLAEARTGCVSGLAVCAAVTVRLLSELASRCQQAADCEEADLLSELSAATHPASASASFSSGSGPGGSGKGRGSSAAPPPSLPMLTGAAFPFATGVERGLWAAHWAAEWVGALLAAATDWAAECASAGRSAAREAQGGRDGGGLEVEIDGACLRIEQEVGGLATHVHEARTMLLPCLKYTTLSDML